MPGADPRDTLTPRQATALVALGAAVISVTALFVKLISLGPTAIGAYRCLFAAVALGVWVAMPRRAAGPVGPSGASRRAIACAVGAGACYAADLYVWHQSILLSGTGLATLLANTQVFWVAVLSALLLGERLSWRLAVCAALALLGVVLLAIPGLAANPVHLQGIGLGLATGVFYAGYYLCLRASQREPRRLSLAANLGVTCVVAALLLGVKFFGGRMLEEIFSMPFKAKGAVLRGAAVDIHAITPVTFADIQALRKNAPNDDDNEDAVPDASRNYFVVEATVKPVAGSSGTFRLWEPGELQLAGPDARPRDSDDEEICCIERVEIETDGRFAADEGMKYDGPRRLHLTVGVVPGTTRLQFRYYFELFGGFTLPA